MDARPTAPQTRTIYFDQALIRFWFILQGSSSTLEYSMHARSTVLALLLAGSTLATAPCSAQNIQPGLWEISSKMQSSDHQFDQAMAKMQKQMAEMPADQRKMMEDMMAKQGVSMSANNGGMQLKLCVTKEMAAQDQMFVQTHGNCTHTRSPLVGNTMKMAFSCTNPTSSGEGQVSFDGDKAYTMRMKIVTAVKGKQESMTIDSDGRWLGGECGAIKPMAATPAK